MKSDPNCFKKEIEEILEKERWIGRMNGIIQGAMSVIDELRIEDKEDRVSVIKRALCLSEATAGKIVDEWGE